MLKLLLVLFCCVALIGCTKAPAAQSTQAVATASPVSKVAHLCGAPTKAGGTCKRRVKVQGTRCWMHTK